MRFPFGAPLSPASANRLRRKRRRGGGASPVVINSVTAGTVIADEIDVTIDATGADNGNDVYVVGFLDGENNPNVAEVKAGQVSGGGAADIIISDVWPLSSPVVLSSPPGGTYRFAVVVNNGADSNVGISNTFVYVSDPLAADTGALFRYNAANVTLSGTDVTNVDDFDGNAFDLNTVPAAFDNPTKTASAIILNAGASPGPTVIQTATAATGNQKMSTHLRGGGSSALRAFIVANAANLHTALGLIFCESENQNSNNSFGFGAFRNSGAISLRLQIRGISDAAVATINTADVAATVGVCVLEFHVTQTTYEMFINGVSKGSGAVTAANFPALTASRVSLGARASDTAQTAASSGDIYEIFVTGTADSTNATTFREALADTYGITL